MFEKIIEAIKQYDTIIIHRHTSPDGDALGSQIGLKHLLQDNFPEKKIYTVGDGAGRYAFMADSTMDEIDDSTYENAMAILLDSASAHLISDERYKLAKFTARIDHHIYCETFTDLEVVNTTYESCCGLVTEFALESGLAFSPRSAKALFTGMVTDSGRFRYDSVNANTFRLASVLMEQKFDTNDIYNNLYADDFEMVRLRAQFILKIKITDHHVGYIYTTKEEFDSYGKDSFTISRGMVNTMADLKGVHSWVNFTDIGEKILVEIRSNKYNINPIAVKYGGGGHQKASGAAIDSYETAMAMLADLNALEGNEK
ncbi:MAG: bifunctional oligoribonuclease/PAP phosphatase NrnA [Clostridia bacterium]|nr:bifunctional oligoribonuclease/PAP phosphatase NrnA [Clostridia bacterium]